LSSPHGEPEQVMSATICDAWFDPAQTRAAFACRKAKYYILLYSHQLDIECMGYWTIHKKNR
jgi:hypothetical protein